MWRLKEIYVIPKRRQAERVCIVFTILRICFYNSLHMFAFAFARGNSKTSELEAFRPEEQSLWVFVQTRLDDFSVDFPSFDADNVLLWHSTERRFTLSLDSLDKPSLTDIPWHSSDATFCAFGRIFSKYVPVFIRRIVNCWENSMLCLEGCQTCAECICQHKPNGCVSVCTNRKQRLEQTKAGSGCISFTFLAPNSVA